MNKSDIYEQIKEKLLKDTDIYEVSVKPAKGLIDITPVQNKDFYYIDQPLEDFIVEGAIRICGKDFEVNDFEYFNTQVLYLQLKEI